MKQTVTNILENMMEQNRLISSINMQCYLLYKQTRYEADSQTWSEMTDLGSNSFKKIISIHGVINSMIHSAIYLFAPILHLFNFCDKETLN